MSRIIHACFVKKCSWKDPVMWDLSFFYHFSIVALEILNDEERGVYAEEMCRHKVTKGRITTIKLSPGNRGLKSLTPGRCSCNLELVIFQFIKSRIDVLSISCALRWTPQDLTDGYSTLVQVMAWCRQPTSRYLSQCWLRYRFIWRHLAIMS